MALCAVRTSDGRVYLWGVFGTKFVFDELVSVDLRGVIDVSLGGEHQCLLTAKG